MLKPVLATGGLYDRLVEELEARGVDMTDAAQAVFAHEFCQRVIADIDGTVRQAHEAAARVAERVHRRA